MRAEKILVEPFEFLNYTELECKRELNRHGELRVTGLIRREKEQDYMNLAAKETWVSVKVITETGETRNFFCGVLTNLWVKKENQLSALTIEIKTGTFLLDIEPHIRSFQDRGLRYEDILRTCTEASMGRYIMLEKEGELAGQFFMQYNETDWEFIKRIASCAGVPLIPEDATMGKKFYFGYQEHKVSHEIAMESYQVEQDYDRYQRRKQTGTAREEKVNANSYILDTREMYSLGENVRFRGHDLVVGRIKSWLKGQELYNEYRLISRENGVLPPVSNDRLSGVSLLANVSAVEKTMVQVTIVEDENKDNRKRRWLDYATVYSSKDGIGWYCMPEVGDEVRVVFPDHNENNAYVASSVHIGAAGGRYNPDEKSWKNKQNKEILFTKEAIVIRNNQGLVLELSDKEGIKLVSNKDIMVRAAGDIQIDSQNAGIQMSAEHSIFMQQGAARIEMDDTIQVKGGKIYMN